MVLERFFEQVYFDSIFITIFKTKENHNLKAFYEGKKNKKKKIEDTPTSSYFKPIYSKVKKYAKQTSKNKVLPIEQSNEVSIQYFNKVLKPGVKSIFGDTVRMSDGQSHGGKETFSKLFIRNRKEYLYCIKDLLENPGFVYYEKPKNENSEVEEDRLPTEIYVGLYHSTNNKGQEINTWVCAPVRIYPDGKYLVSIYPYENQEELRNKVLRCNKIYDVEAGVWVNEPVENKSAESDATANLSLPNPSDNDN